MLSVSGEKLSRLFGMMMDTADSAGLEDTLAKGDTVMEASAEMIEQAKGYSAGLEAAWLKKAEKKRISDPQAALDYYRSQVAELGAQ